MDCKTAQFLIDLSRPRAPELDARELESLESHLAECPTCAQLAHTQQRIDAHLGAAMRAVPLPEGLRQRLVRRLAGERGAAHRRRWLHSVGSFAAAAAILLALTLGWGLHSAPPAVDFEKLVDISVTEMANPDRDRVDDWLKTIHVKTPAPDHFDYRLFRSYHLADLQGQRVPLLLFTRTENAQVYQARVYLLSADQFDLRALAASLPVASLCKIAVLSQPHHPRHAYLVVYTGEALEPFLAPEQQSKL